MIHFALLLQAPEESVTPARVALEYIGFLSFFGVYGALGFHFQVLRNLRAGDAAAPGNVVNRADRRAAAIGLIGALLMIAVLMNGLLQRAAEKSLPLMQVIAAGGARQIFQMACIALFFICFGLATQRIRVAWIVAGVVGVVFALRNITTGRWFSMVNPLHEVAASLWIGTLAVLALAGLTTVFRSSVTGDRRGQLVAEMVSRFSPLALGAAALLGITGVTTAWRHLKHLNSLWTSPYGITLDIKLCFVAIVIALGGWNWRRMRPKLGNEQAAVAIARSASAELSFAAIVVALTALLVSLPSPGPSGPPGAGPPGAEGPRANGDRREGGPRSGAQRTRETKTPR